MRIAIGIAGALCLLAGEASAGDWGFAGSVAVTSDYRFRGISQNDKDAALQASLNLNGPDGFYVGSWASQVDFKDHADTSIEWDIYAGKHFDLGDGLDWNIEPYYYAYPDHNSKKAGFHDSYFELIDTLTKTFDNKLVLAGTVAWSPDFFAETGTGWWINANASYPINDWLTVSGNAGHQWASDLDRIKGVGFPYTEWDLGLTAAWKSFTLDVRYVDTSISKTDCANLNGPGNGGWCTATVLATLTYNFSGP